MTPAEAAASSGSGDPTGPFRRVWSVTGYSWMSAEIYLPSMARGEIGYSREGGETAHIFSGGWGANGEAVASGLQHNAGRDDWSLFLKYTNDFLEFDAGAPHLSAGQWINFFYSVPADGVLRLTVSGILGQGGHQTVSLDYPSPENVTGWTAAGHGQILTRMTAIAQDSEDFSSGSFLHNVQWKNVHIGTSPDTKTTWHAAQNGGASMHPTSAQFPNVITASVTDPANEIISIRCQAS